MVAFEKKRLVLVMRCWSARGDAADGEPKDNQATKIVFDVVCLLLKIMIMVLPPLTIKNFVYHNDALPNAG